MCPATAPVSPVTLTWKASAVSPTASKLAVPDAVDVTAGTSLEPDSVALNFSVAGPVPSDLPQPAAVQARAIRARWDRDT